MNTIRVKIILVGNSGVGKTSIVRRYVSDEFSERHIETLGARVEKHTVSMDSVQVEMMIWDLAGEQNVSNLKASFVQGANGVLYVADVANAESIRSVRDYAAHCRSLLDQPVEYLLLNKSDLSPAQDADAAIVELDVETSWALSAKTGDKVPAMFGALASRLVKSLALDSQASQG